MLSCAMQLQLNVFVQKLKLQLSQIKCIGRTPFFAKKWTLAPNPISFGAHII